MEQKKDLSIINCIGSALLAVFFTVPVHEFVHFITFYIYGDKCEYFAATSVNNLGLIDYSSLSPFHRILATGGSASLVNLIIGIILLIILLKVSMGPTLRMFFIQLMGTHLAVSFGYFMADGIFGAGDWGNVFSYFPNDPGFVSAMRIVLSIVGVAGIVCLFFILNYMSYYYIEDPTDNKQRTAVAAKLHLTMLIVGLITHFAAWAFNPQVVASGMSSAVFLSALTWIPFLWAFLFTGPMKVLPPKKSRFLYKLPEKPNWILFASGVILILVDIFIFGPGIYLN